MIFQIFSVSQFVTEPNLKSGLAIKLHAFSIKKISRSKTFVYPTSPMNLIKKTEKITVANIKFVVDR